ncbi:MAG TPA: intradiol ring-cleavage dioxygenase [Anaerolineae bacterium]|nr:intradiol ring-cleavage dioxygenase [Anaerolineae bacterium]
MSDPNIFDLGLHADLKMWQKSPVTRRRFLTMGAATLALYLTGCQDDTTSPPIPPTPTNSPTTTSPTTPLANLPTTTDTCVDTIPPETPGPFPANNAQAINILTAAGIVRQDIRTSLGTGHTAPGLPCTIELTLVNTNNNCAPLANHALYIWHCDRDGSYSLYSPAAVAEDYLRGVQESDAQGKLSFTTIFPACYPGRWPHAHFEIYPSLAQATTAQNAIYTSQLALPADVCQAVYATPPYQESASYLSRLSLETDGVFRDGADLQLATAEGDPNTGYTIRLTIGIPA